MAALLMEQVPTSHALRILQDIDGDGTLDLFNVVGQVPTAERYSDWWDHDTEFSSANNLDDGTAEHSELDHMLLTPGLRDRVTRVWIDHGHNPADVSDHWPLMAQLRRQPADVAWGALASPQVPGSGTPVSGGGSGSGSGWLVLVLLVVVVIGAVAARSKKWSASKVSGEGGGIYDGQSQSDVP